MHAQLSNKLLIMNGFQGHAEAAVALISAGADIAARDNLGRTPLMEACVHGHDDMIELLTRQGATCVPSTFLLATRRGSGDVFCGVSSCCLVYQRAPHAVLHGLGIEDALTVV